LPDTESNAQELQKVPPVGKVKFNCAKTFLKTTVPEREGETSAPTQPLKPKPDCGRTIVSPLATKNELNDSVSGSTLVPRRTTLFVAAGEKARFFARTPVPE